MSNHCGSAAQTSLIAILPSGVLHEAIALHGDEVDHDRHESRRVEQGLQEREPPDRQGSGAAVPTWSIDRLVDRSAPGAGRRLAYGRRRPVEGLRPRRRRPRRLVARDVLAGPVRQVAEPERQHEQPAEMHERPADDRERVAAAARLVAPRVRLDEQVRVGVGLGDAPLPERSELVARRLGDVVGRGAEHVGRRRVRDAMHAKFEHPFITHLESPRQAPPAMMGPSLRQLSKPRIPPSWGGASGIMRASTSARSDAPSHASGIAATSGGS